MTIGTVVDSGNLYERRHGQFVMLTAYDILVAGVFDRVGVPLLVVGALPFGAYQPGRAPGASPGGGGIPVMGHLG